MCTKRDGSLVSTPLVTQNRTRRGATPHAWGVGVASRVAGPSRKLVLAWGVRYSRRNNAGCAGVRPAAPDMPPPDRCIVRPSKTCSHTARRHGGCCLVPSRSKECSELGNLSEIFLVLPRRHAFARCYPFVGGPRSVGVPALCGLRSQVEAQVDVLCGGEGLPLQRLASAAIVVTLTAC